VAFARALAISRGAVTVRRGAVALTTSQLGPAKTIKKLGGAIMHHRSGVMDPCGTEIGSFDARREQKIRAVTDSHNPNNPINASSMSPRHRSRSQRRARRTERQSATQITHDQRTPPTASGPGLTVARSGRGG
jgi:hypothetical protein